MKKVIKLFVFIAFIAVIVFPAAAQSLSGTFTYRSFDNALMEMIFDGNSFSMKINGTVTLSGTYRVSGSRVFLNNNTSAFFTIIDTNTLRDSEGASWKKENG